MITGAAGLVGRAVAEAWARAGDQIVGFDHAALDITDEQEVYATIERERPEVLINCAAWTDVDGCELNPERAQTVNARGPHLLARACRRAGALLITISTDYVFDGEKDGFYTQRDQPNPQSAYAVSKLAGERLAQTAWARTIVVRSGYIFGHGGTNFLSSIVERAQRGERLRAINDSYGTPTYAPHLADRLRQLAQLDLPGTYHVVNSGAGASFEDFARLALAYAGLEIDLVEGVSMRTLTRPAPRPQNSRLRCLLSEAIGLAEMPSWKSGVRDFVATGPAAATAGASPTLI
ncbi:MAG TPA: dTDP-4-dehydrorhamnose reductase [Pyrinomonadaceae bacterium]|nr:dTDP-4-dehydrorhamnose reductase [Pyrinomonadaceae bacterium]